jgi:hypothetical protein
MFAACARTNALRHTPSDGSILVRAKRRDCELEVSVEDTGVGLSKEAQQRMFEPARPGRGNRGSTVSLPAGSGPDDILIDPRGRRLVVDLDNTSTIASFHVRHDGLLVAAPGSPIAAQGAGPFGAEFRPSNPSQLFVSNAHGGAGNGTVSVFLASGSTGQLASIGASPSREARRSRSSSPHLRGMRYPFAGRIRANATPRPTQTPSWRLVANPSAETSIQPFIGRPVMSKTRV